MTHYHEVFGGDLMISTFGEFRASEDPAEADKVTHSMIETPNGRTLMATDTPNVMACTHGTNFSVSRSGKDEVMLGGFWNRLSDGGSITMPLERAPWGDDFGMCTDRFAVPWLVSIADPKG